MHQTPKEAEAARHMMIVCSTLYGKKRLVAKGDLSVRRSAYAVILDREQLLLVRLGRTGKYWFPGGAIENRETLGDALMREVHEETGIAISVDEVLTEVENYWYDDTCDAAYKAIGAFVRCRPVTVALSGEANPDSAWEYPEWVALDRLTPDDFHDYGGEILQFIR